MVDQEVRELFALPLESLALARLAAERAEQEAGGGDVERREGGEAVVAGERQPQDRGRIDGREREGDRGAPERREGAEHGGDLCARRAITEAAETLGGAIGARQRVDARAARSDVDRFPKPRVPAPMRALPTTGRLLRGLGAGALAAGAIAIAAGATVYFTEDAPPFLVEKL